MSKASNSSTYEFKIFPTVKWETWETKADRIQKHLQEFSTPELEELLRTGKTIYGPDSALDTETDISDEIEAEIEHRLDAEQQELERSANPEWSQFS